jgi:fibronectin-binding autotransporter adhesin
VNLSKYSKVVFSLAAGILLLIGLLLVLRVPPVQANAGILYVSSTDPACGGQSPCYTTIQDAVDAASDGDVIKVAAGVYTGVQTRASITQVVYLSKSLTIQGGYTTADWNTSDPDANLATLDAQGLGRGLVISGVITATVEGLRITGGDAAGLGGGFPLGSDAGGGVCIYTATVTISNCVVYSNTGSTAASGYGGGLYLAHSAASLNGNMVISNTASTAGSGRGGGLYLAHSDGTLSGNTVKGNTASTARAADGGGLYFWSSTATLSGNMVQGNTASTGSIGFGGGLYFSGGAATLSGNTVQGNTASNPGWGHGGRSYPLGGDAIQCGEIDIVGAGGGLYLSGSTATLSSNTVISNTASTVAGGVGGGLSLYSSTATLNGNTVQGNTASTGAGLYSGGVGGGLQLRRSSATLSGNTVQGNTASTASIGEGGGLYILRSTSTLSDNMVQGNTASTADCGIGGGLSLADSDATLSDNTVISNTATMNPTAAGRGGGLWIWGSSPFTLTNNLVASNHANTEGSGLWFKGESAYPTSGHLRHTTIADNNGGSGQGVHAGDYTTLAFTNTIIAGHDIVGITVTTGSTATLEATLWYNSGSQIGGGGYIFTGTISVDGDPAFVNPSAWDYHLTAGSPAIDAGVDAGVRTDIDGDSRPQGTGYDIGADEYIAHIYLPIVLRNYRP